MFRSQFHRSWSGKKNLKIGTAFNPLNAELNPIRHLLALAGAHHFVHVSRIRVNAACHNFASPDLYNILGTASLLSCNCKKTSHFFTNQLRTADTVMCRLVSAVERYDEWTAVKECGQHDNILSTTHLNLNTPETSY
jgi:hypothetical protein